MSEIPDNNEVREVIRSMHEYIIKKVPRDSRDSEIMKNPDIVQDNRLFLMVCEDPARDPGEYARDMIKKYGYDITGKKVIHIFRSYSISTPEKREELYSWASGVADKFIQCLKSRKRTDFAMLKEAYNTSPVFIDNKRLKNKVLCLMLYVRYPEINIYHDLEGLECFGYTFAKYFFYEALDILDSFCTEEDENKDSGNKVNKNNKAVSNKDELTLERERYIRKINQLSAALERADNAMKDLETEFEERLEEEKKHEFN